jgi:hypothetical protein
MLAGCENTIEPFDRGRGLYSIYGVLDLYKDINYIRVKDLNEPLTEDETDNIDATVTLRNINENNTETLQDTLIAFENVFTHNFRTTMSITPDTRYEITVERSDGESISVTATTPHIADVNWGPTNETCITPVEITFEPVHHPNDLELSVGFNYDDARFWANPKATSFRDKLLTYRFAPIDILNEIFLPPGPDSEPIRCFQLDNENLFIEYTHFGPDFEDIDFDSLNAPEGTIEFGALYEDSFSFPIDTVRVCPPLIC